MKSLYRDIQHTISEANITIKKLVNRKRKLGPQLKKGDKVYLLIKNLKGIRLSRKLDYIKVGLFLVIRNKGPINYKLQLLPNAKIYLVFYILILELVDPNTPL